MIEFETYCFRESNFSVHVWTQKSPQFEGLFVVVGSGVDSEVSRAVQVLASKLTMPDQTVTSVIHHFIGGGKSLPMSLVTVMDDFDRSQGARQNVETAWLPTTWPST